MIIAIIIAVALFCAFLFTYALCETAKRSDEISERYEEERKKKDVK